MKKMLILFGSLVLGAAVSTGIDGLIGLSFDNVNVITQFTHKAVYMVWGAIVVALMIRFG